MSLNSLSKPLLLKSITFFTVVFVYFLISYFVKSFVSIEQNTPFFWSTSGLTIGCLILLGPKLSPAIFLGSLIFNFSTSISSAALISIAFGNTLEALVGSQIILAIYRKSYLKNYAEFFAIIIGAFFSSALSATFTMSSFYHEGLIHLEDFISQWSIYWGHNTISTIIFLPIIMEFYPGQKDNRDFSWAKLLLSLLPGLFIFFLVYRVFIEGQNQAYLWILAPVFIFIGLKYGRLISRLMLLFVSLFIFYLTAKGYGPFEHGNFSQNFIYTQCLLFAYGSAVLFVKPFSVKLGLGPYFILGMIVSWACLFSVIYVTSNNEKEHMVSDLNRSMAVALDSMAKINQQYETLLLSGKAMLKMNPQMNQKEWETFVASLNLATHLGPSHSFGFVKVIPKEAAEIFKKEMRTKTNSDFHIKVLNPEYSKRFPNHFVMTLLAPLEDNRGLLGLDMGSEKMRREAAWKSRRLKETSATETIQLVHDQFKRPSFTIFHPVWDQKEKFLGWIVIPLIGESFFERAFVHQGHLLRIKVIRGGKTIFDNQKQISGNEGNFGHFHLEKKLNVFGQSYIFEFYPVKAFFRRNSHALTFLALTMSLFILFITGLLLEQITFGHKSETLVHERTKELEISKIQLIHSSKMASLGEMASGMAHEINNPLTIILGKISVIRIMLEDLKINNPSLLGEINKIKSTTDRIGKIVSGLRTFSRSSNNDPFETIPLRDIIAETFNLCAERLKGEGIELKVDPIPNVKIICRPGQISQVFLNLFNNANDAIENLEEKWIHLSFRLKNNNRILIFVTDSGHGISPQIAEKIMEPFFTTKDVQKGTGLGLSIVKGIIENHGGQFWLDMDFPRTRFVIEIKSENS